ncbi:Exonuclease 3'-5' domain-containing protein 2 [Geranomyces michiganensis]|nr:Exonuclease 3'-5' domain-containing protein 2 [Geranomyces michiganensis]
MTVPHMLARASPLYDNCTVFSPQGVPMFRASRKKLDWYLARGLAETVDETSIRLLFEPAGTGHGLKGEETYFLEDKRNICVPLQYRRNMPLEIKSHYSIDVVLLCVACHNLYERHAGELKLHLSEVYNAPLNGTGLILHRETRKLHSDINAMLMCRTPGSRIPPERARQLENGVRHALGIASDEAQIPDEAIQEALERPVLVKGEDFKSHGALVVQSVSADLEAFVRMWREHFIQHVRPRFLSEAWRIDGPVRRSL